MKKYIIVSFVLLISSCSVYKEVGSISVSYKNENKTINIYNTFSHYFTNASLIKSDTSKHYYQDLITNGDDIVIIFTFDYNTKTISATDAFQLYTTYLEIKNFQGENSTIELDSTNSVVYTKYQTFLVLNYFFNPHGSVNVTRKNNDSLLVKIQLEYANGLALKGEFIALKDTSNSKYF